MIVANTMQGRKADTPLGPFSYLMAIEDTSEFATIHFVNPHHRHEEQHQKQQNNLG
jgi:hypothetical protein